MYYTGYYTRNKSKNMKTRGRKLVSSCDNHLNGSMFLSIYAVSDDDCDVCGDGAFYSSLSSVSNGFFHH